MNRRAVDCAFDDDDVHTVDIVVKRPGVARLTRLSAPADVEAAMRLLRGLADRDGEAAGRGAGPETDADRQQQAPEPTSVG